MQEDNKAEDERGIRGTMHIGEEVDVGIGAAGREVWGMAALVLEVVELMAKLTDRIGQTYRIG